MRKLPDLSNYWSEDEGRRVIEAWRQSGESATVFARRHGLRAKRLVYWGKRLAANASTAATVSFVPAAVVAPDEVAAMIRTPGGVAIELASASPAQIAAVANALARTSP